VTSQLALVQEIMAAVTATKNTLQSQLQTLKTELDELQTMYDTLRTCLGG